MSKDNQKVKKTSRWDMRVVPELDERAKQLAKELGKSRNAFIEHIAWKVVLSQRDYFVCCPDCGQALFDIEEMPILEGVQEIECDKGHKHNFDFASNKFV